MNALLHSVMTKIPKLRLAIPNTSQAQVWRQSKNSYTTAGNYWQAALDRACLDALLPWLLERDPHARIWTNPAHLSSFWEIVPGSAIDLDRYRCVLMPTNAIDFTELRVPQEWVDLPSWAGDYYLSIYVDLEEAEIQILGYTSHKSLKHYGRFDPIDRSYSLNSEELIADINVLWLARKLCPTEVLRDEIQPLPQLSLAQAQSLLSRLGDSNIVRPRLAIPFVLWGGAIEHGGWRQQLYRQRLGLPEQWSIAEWLQAGVSQLAQQVGWELMTMEPSLVSARGTDLHAPRALLRQLSIAGRSYELHVVSTGVDLWRFELHSASAQPIPAGFKLRLLTEDLSPFANNEDVASSDSDLLYLEVKLCSGDALVWETEPQPDLFDREIVRF